MNAQSTTQRVKNYYQRMKDKGFNQVRIWVPAGKESLIQEVAEALRDGKGVVIHNEESGKDDSGKLAPKPDNTHSATIKGESHGQ